MMTENHIQKLIISAVDAMKTTEWQWPPAWNAKMKLKFLDDINNWLLERELYEQCEILQNLKNEL
tara:strand:- start:168 stop:362 length:195 start_codon:yes stop_codon:yes gene_type:complete